MQSASEVGMRKVGGELLDEGRWDEGRWMREVDEGGGMREVG